MKDQQVHIRDLKNLEGFTLLHMCAFKDKNKSFNKVIKAANDYFFGQGLPIKEWLNK